MKPKLRFAIFYFLLLKNQWQEMSKPYIHTNIRTVSYRTDIVTPGLKRRDEHNMEHHLYEYECRVALFGRVKK